MGKIGFRTQLFGFNKDDVNLYLEKVNMSLSEKEKCFLEEKEVLEKDLAEFKEKTERLEKDVTSLLEQVAYYKDKEKEIEKLSVKIGDMYLVAKQNAAKVVSDAENLADTINEQAKIELEVAQNTSKNLENIKDSFGKAADELLNNINTLTAELETSKNKLAQKIKEKETKDGES